MVAVYENIVNRWLADYDCVSLKTSVKFDEDNGMLFNFGNDEQEIATNGIVLPNPINTMRRVFICAHEIGHKVFHFSDLKIHLEYQEEFSATRFAQALFAQDHLSIDTETVEMSYHRIRSTMLRAMKQYGQRAGDLGIFESITNEKFGDDKNNDRFFQRRMKYFRIMEIIYNTIPPKEKDEDYERFVVWFKKEEISK